MRARTSPPRFSIAVVGLILFGAASACIGSGDGSGGDDQNITGAPVVLFGNDRVGRMLKDHPEKERQLWRGFEGHTFEDVRPVLRAVTENVLLDIQKTFDFFKATTGSDRIDAIVLSGGTSAIDGLVEGLAARFNVPVERFDPFRQVTVDPSRQISSDLTASVAVAVGLALRKAGDR